MPFRIGPWEIALILLIIFGAPAYFVPTIVAVVRHAKQKLAIILLNIFAGWTIIGWIAALVWSIIGQKETQK